MNKNQTLFEQSCGPKEGTYFLVDRKKWYFDNGFMVVAERTAGTIQPDGKRHMSTVTNPKWKLIFYSYNDADENYSQYALQPYAPVTSNEIEAILKDTMNWEIDKRSPSDGTPWGIDTPAERRIGIREKRGIETLKDIEDALETE